MIILLAKTIRNTFIAANKKGGEIHPLRVATVIIILIAIGLFNFIIVNWVPNTAPHKQEAVILGLRNKSSLSDLKSSLIII